MDGQCLVLNLGLCDYNEAYSLQQRLVLERAAGTMPDTLLLLNHPPVYTIGRSGTREHILVSDAVLAREGITVHETDRGGDVTYHGPGQLVGYPILDVRQYGKDLHKLLHLYEEVLIRALWEYGIKAVRIPEYPGVWVGQEKIGALGIGVSHWVSYHGWALNINPNMAHFNYMTPCGIKDKGVTSMKDLLGRDVSQEEVAARVIKKFGEVFHLQMVEGSG